MSDTLIIIALAVGASVVITFCCLILVVRLRRVMKSQLETVDSLLSALRAGQGRDTPREPS